MLEEYSSCSSVWVLGKYSRNTFSIRLIMAVSTAPPLASRKPGFDHQKRVEMFLPLPFTLVQEDVVSFALHVVKRHGAAHPIFSSVCNLKRGGHIFEWHNLDVLLAPGSGEHLSSRISNVCSPQG